MLTKVVEMLYKKDPSILSRLAHEGTLTYVKEDKTKLRDPFEIDNGIFLDKHSNTNWKIDRLKELFKAYGLDPKDLQFYLKND